jgi:hypothetical protein
MRKTVVILLGLFYGGSLLSQTDSSKSKTDFVDIMDEPEQSPYFPGGDAALFKFLTSNLKYSTCDSISSGKTIASFVIDVTGAVTDVTIIKGACPEHSKEVLRVLRLMPKWEPAKEGGKAISKKMIIPIQVDWK